MLTIEQENIIRQELSKSTADEFVKVAEDDFSGAEWR